jgi:hypothetical protein
MSIRTIIKEVEAYRRVVFSKEYPFGCLTKGVKQLQRGLKSRQVPGYLTPRNIHHIILCIRPPRYEGDEYSVLSYTDMALGGASKSKFRALLYAAVVLGTLQQNKLESWYVRLRVEGRLCPTCKRTIIACDGCPCTMGHQAYASAVRIQKENEAEEAASDAVKEEK